MRNVPDVPSGSIFGHSKTVSHKQALVDKGNVLSMMFTP